MQGLVICPLKKLHPRIPQENQMGWADFLGEVNFVWAGFLLQITSQLAECSKNLIGEMVMSGAGDGSTMVNHPLVNAVTRPKWLPFAYMICKHALVFKEEKSIGPVVPQLLGFSMSGEALDEAIKLLKGQLCCECKACCTWRRLGALIGIGHQDSSVTEFLHNGLGELLVEALDNFRSQSPPPTTTSTPVAAGTEVAQAEREDPREEGAREAEEETPGSVRESKGSSDRRQKEEKVKSDQSGEERSRKERKGRDRSRSRRRRKNSGPSVADQPRSKEGGEAKSKQVTPVEGSELPKHEKVSPEKEKLSSTGAGKTLFKPSGTSSSARPSSSKPDSKREDSKGSREDKVRGSSRPKERTDRRPGKWEKPTWVLRPRSPDHPPPGYKGSPRRHHQGRGRGRGGQAKNKGLERVRRLQDIKRYGPSSQRKQWREDQRGWCQRNLQLPKLLWGELRKQQSKQFSRGQLQRRRVWRIHSK